MNKQVKVPRSMIVTLVTLKELAEGQKGYVRQSDIWVDKDRLMWIEADAIVSPEPSHRFTMGSEGRIRRVEGGVALEISSEASFIPTDRSYVRNFLPVVGLKIVEQ